MHLKNEVVWDKDKTHATYNRSIQMLQQDAKRIILVVNLITNMEPYLSKHRLKEYDNLLMQNTIIRIKQKSLQLQTSNVDTWWNLVQDFFQIGLKTLFDEHKAYETSYRKKLKA